MDGIIEFNDDANYLATSCRLVATGAWCTDIYLHRIANRLCYVGHRCMYGGYAA
jgi:hypothetical protein